MPDIRSRRGHAPRRSARRARVLTFAVLIVSATLSGTASYDGGEPANAARAEVPHFAPSPAPDADLPSSTAPSIAGTPAAGATDAPVAGAPTEVAPKQMSMDEPIQGGLTAHQEQAISARLIAKHEEPKSAPKSDSWTAAAGRTAVARAESWLGMPYSWAGGSATGPTAGRCEPNTGGDLDCHVVGFDCSGLMMYAWGPYVSLPHLAETQRDAGRFHPSVKQLLPGDMVFFSGYIAGGIGHVAIYTGDGMVIEAPESGSVVKRSKLKDLIAADGYRGAVRPLTAATPVLTAPSASVRTSGGLVTVRGTDLAGVHALRVDDTVVTEFVKQTDTAIVFRAPKHAAGTVAVSVSTGWHALSKPVALIYVKPRPAKPTAPSSPKPSTPAPSSPKPTPPSSSSPKPAPKPDPTKPTPPDSSSAAPVKGSTTPVTPTPSDPPTGSDTTAPVVP